VHSCDSWVSHEDTLFLRWSDMDVGNVSPIPSQCLIGSRCPIMTACRGRDTGRGRGRAVLTMARLGSCGQPCSYRSCQVAGEDTAPQPLGIPVLACPKLETAGLVALCNHKQNVSQARHTQWCQPRQSQIVESPLISSPAQEQPTPSRPKAHDATDTLGSRQ